MYEARKLKFEPSYSIVSSVLQERSLQNEKPIKGKQLSLRQESLSRN